MFLISGEHETAEVGSGRFPVALPLLSVTSRWDVVGSSDICFINLYKWLTYIFERSCFLQPGSLQLLVAWEVLDHLGPTFFPAGTETARTKGPERQDSGNDISWLGMIVVHVPIVFITSKKNWLPTHFPSDLSRWIATLNAAGMVCSSPIQPVCPPRLTWERPAWHVL